MRLAFIKAEDPELLLHNLREYWKLKGDYHEYMARVNLQLKSMEPEDCVKNFLEIYGTETGYIGALFTAESLFKYHMQYCITSAHFISDSLRKRQYNSSRFR